MTQKRKKKLANRGSPSAGVDAVSSDIPSTSALDSSWEDGAATEAGQLPAKSNAQEAAHTVTVVAAETPPSPVVSDDVVAIPEDATTKVPGGPDEAGGTKSPAKRRRWTAGRALRWVAGIAGLLVLILVGWGTFLIVRLQGRIYVPLPPTPTVPAIVLVATPTNAIVASTTKQPTMVIAPTPDRIKDLPPGRVNILVLGTDKRENDPDHFARSDTLLLANVDTISHTVHIMSIPRDLIVDIPDYGKNKVNAAYLFGEYYKEPGGGQALALRTLSQFFDVPIDYYVAVNFDGFRKVVDTVGGVDIDVPYSIDDFNYPSDDEGDPYGELHVHFDEGWQHMDGKTALRYARTRHADNDFARNRRQLQVIMAVRQKALSLDLLPALPGLIEDLGGMVQTNVPFDQQLGFVQLGYSLGPSGVITSSIDAEMIIPSTLPDGSEGLKLDMTLAQPMLDTFFGLDMAGSASDSSIEPRDKLTPLPTAKSGNTPAPTRVPTRTKAKSP